MNPAYYGNTIFNQTRRIGTKTEKRPESDWVIPPDVTPPIIDHELFDKAQKALKQRKSVPGKALVEYLLGGHVYCPVCGSRITGTMLNGRYRYYRCAGRKKSYAPVERCQNKSWKAETLENSVWAGLERYLNDRDLINNEIEKLRQGTSNVEVFEAELERIERQLKSADREQHRLLQWALKGFPESQVEAENKRLNQAKRTLEAQKAEIEMQIKASRELFMNIPDLERYIDDVQHHLTELDDEGKRIALDMLGITVWLDGEIVEISSTLDPGIMLTPSRGLRPLSIFLPLSKQNYLRCFL